jgi:putative membrane protein
VSEGARSADSQSQPQRTALAWSRTALAGAALAAAAIKAAIDRPGAAALICAVVTSLAALGIFGCGQARARNRARLASPAPAVFRLAIGCAVAGALATAVLVGLPR